jgi:four helix bundle protein
MNYKKLIVWQKSMDLVIEIYDLLNQFPKIEEYALKDQIRRSAVSIPSNLVEGSSREKKEFKHYVKISLGSLYELNTQLEIAYRLKYIDKLPESIFQIERMLKSLLKSL